MAGEWIKVDKTLLEKPEVLALADRTGLSVGHVVATLLAFWAWADDHTTDGTLPHVTPERLALLLAKHLGAVTSVVGGATRGATVAPRVAPPARATEAPRGATGAPPPDDVAPRGATEARHASDQHLIAQVFVDALKEVGWVQFDEKGAKVPAFDSHFTQTSKERAQKRLRQARYRATRGATRGATVAPPWRAVAPLEGEREYKNTPLPPCGSEGGATRGATHPFPEEGSKNQETEKTKTESLILPVERYTASDRPDLAAAAGRVVERYHQRVQPATRAHAGGVTAVIRLLANGETEAQLLAAADRFGVFVGEQNRRAEMRPSAASFFRPDGQWSDMLAAATKAAAPLTAMERVMATNDSGIQDAYGNLLDAAAGRKHPAARPGWGLKPDGSMDLEWMEARCALPLQRARRKGLPPIWRGESATWDDVVGLIRWENEKPTEESMQAARERIEARQRARTAGGAA